MFQVDKMELKDIPLFLLLCVDVLSGIKISPSVLLAVHN